MLHKNFVIALQFADAFVVSPVQLLQLLRLVRQQLLPPLELPLRPLVVCLAVVLVRNRRGNYQIFIFLSHSFSISFISLCAYDTAPAPSGGLFFGAPTPGMFITDAFTSVSSTLYPNSHVSGTAPAFGQPAPAPAFGAAPAPATGGLFGSVPGKDIS